ncbi:MAG: UDP-N-acetylmuramoyl-L-alanyl-D-glutamate--2,6-diaminopimelate ligase [Bifidobacteriaceae bacterium]|nr:UDP-N-acetylmuramoyl-L-alanyl-D-glutamate--2,6-diaminopimelate ligase [Bifidobacteriaceae bacterium]
MLRPAHPPSHSLADAAPALPGARLVGAAPALHGLTLDSKAVQPGDLFVALPGAKTHGARFAAAALAGGAAAVLTDRVGEALVDPATPRLVVDDLRAKLGAFSAWFYGHPAERLALVGVTGTNGKTTVAHLLEAGLAPKFGEVALLGTIVSRIGGEAAVSTRTTPEAPALQAAFAAMVERGVRALVMEVSSHALDLHRVDGFIFDLMAFTNLTRDHLDYHRTMEDYFAAKAKAFTAAHAALGLVDVDTPWGARLATEATIPVETLSHEAGADWFYQQVSGAQLRGAERFELSRDGGVPLAAEVAIPGSYNVANAALALASAIILGVDPAQAAKAVAGVRSVPGRMEPVSGPPGSPYVVVDYAHAPESVARVLQALRPHTAGRLIAVLGAGGERDHGKRQLMGAAAAKVADLVFVTDDNPRGEDPAMIRSAVLSGAGPNVREIADRGHAIGQAIAGTGPADTVVILGKGHETTIDYGHELRPHHDATVARAALERKEELNP